MRLVTFREALISEAISRSWTGLGKEGAGAKSPESAANRVGVAPSLLRASTRPQIYLCKGELPCGVN